MERYNEPIQERRNITIKKPQLTENKLKIEWEKCEKELNSQIAHLRK
jgi:hypothetical protein